MAVDFTLPLVRRPLPPTLDPSDVASLRVWMTQLVAGEFATNGDVAPRLRMICPAHLEEAPLGNLGADPAWGAALWDNLADRAEVLRSFRIGVAELPVPADVDAPTAVEVRRCACILERVRGEGQRWWLGFWQLPEEVDTDGTISWFSCEGAGYATLPAPVRAWSDADGRMVDVEARDGDADLGEAVPDGRMIVHFAELAAPSPRDAAPLAKLALSMLARADLADLSRRHAPIIVVLRGRSIERWYGVGKQPCSMDDLVRNLCSLGEPPDGVVVIEREPALPGEVYRVSVEGRDGRLARTWEPGDPPTLGRPAREPPGFDAWIGVTPEVDLGLEPELERGFSPGGDEFH